ncbi:hypothetical protein RhiirA1_388380 [Rhizophagus irregularis]|uniref:Uncharacterized protein n=1 Tax=Rhizophagus irregularis TaxID=588596 RepID=A0A2N0SF23_9GLOM|nr:hypothetical protein RhiirA1_388380 [Rhizophagus irregularis]
MENFKPLGTYPPSPKFTQKPRNNAPQYSIPNNYIVKTEVSGWTLRCETKYTLNLKKHSTKLSGPRLFGLDIKQLYNFRLQIGSLPITTTATKVNERKRPLEDITSQSQQNKRINSFGCDIQKAVDELIIKHKLTNSSGQPIMHMHYIEFDYKENQTYIKFGDSNFTTTQTRLDSIINELINIQIYIRNFNIDKEINNQSSIDDDVNEYTGDILIDDHEIGNEAFRSLLTLLKALIHIWKAEENPVIISENTLYIKLSGDGRNVGRKQNHVKENLHYFYLAINQENYIPDELHLLLRISDVLIEYLFADLIKNKDFSKQIKLAIELAFKNIKVYFEFFQSKSTGKQWNWTSLMGPDKKIMLEKFPVSQFIQAHLSNQEIDQFEIDAQNWICIFCHPTQGYINSPIQIPGLYRKEDVMPYMHIFAKHVPQFLRQLKEKGFSLQILSTSSIEKKNHNQVCLFFGGTTMGGGTDGKSVVYNIMSFENHQLFYLINNTPKKIVARNIDVNKEN